MKALFDWIPPSKHKTVFYALFACTLILLAIFQPLNAPLTNSAAPAGIISLQIAWTPEKAQIILESWDIGAYLFAAFGLGFDYLLMVSYAFTVGVGILLAASRRVGGFARLGTLALWGVILAAILDALENFGQAQEVLFGTIASWPYLIGICAYLKFILLLAGILYGLAGWLWPKPK